MADTKSSRGLWNKNFTGFTIATFAEYMSNAGISFVLSLLVLDITNSVLLYGMYLVLYYSANVFVPLFIGPIIEKHRKERINAACCLGNALLYSAYLILYIKGINAMAFTFLLAILSGISNAIFCVSSNALMMNIVKKDYIQKAYSIYSGIEICSEVTVPIATILYKKIGLNPIILSCSVLLFTASIILLTAIKLEGGVEESRSTKEYGKDLRDGIKFVIDNKAYLLVCLAFLLCAMTTGIRRAVWLPFFNSKAGNAYLWYFGVYAAFSTGMFHASFLIYMLKIRKNHRFSLTVISFIIICIGMVAALYFNNITSVIIGYIVGVCDGIFNNMKSVSVFAHLDEDKRSRFTGIFMAFSNLGMIIGMAISSVLSNSLPLISVNAVLGIFVMILFIPVYLGKGRKLVKDLYNDVDNQIE